MSSRYTVLVQVEHVTETERQSRGLIPGFELDVQTENVLTVEVAAASKAEALEKASRLLDTESQ